jgi:HSP20 family molecular chaperone IbpA
MATDKALINDSKSQRRVYVPVADIYETEDLYCLKLEMPGATKDSIDITLENNELVIEGKSSLQDNSNRQIRYSEFSNMDYRRSFRIGNDIDSSKVEAKFDDGVLTLLLYKHEAVKPKKISINHAN